MLPRGITLFELLAVLVVVGVLAAFAIPVFRAHTLRVNRDEAMSALMQLQSAEESHYLRHGIYTANVTAAPPSGLGLNAASASNKYSLVVALAADGQSYIATARPVGEQAADHECLAFSVDARGRRAVSGPAGNQRCWR